MARIIGICIGYRDTSKTRVEQRQNIGVIGIKTQYLYTSLKISKPLKITVFKGFLCIAV